MKIHIIVATEHTEKVYECLNCMIEKEDFLYISHTQEPYWKIQFMNDIYFEVDCKNARTETEWVELFDRYLKHNDICRDEDSLEICHYSEVGNRNDPFVIAYIPVQSII